MGKKPWTTVEQRGWLEALVPAFIQAQEDKTTGVFFEDTFKEWHKKWLSPEPTEDEIKAAAGSTDKALAVKHKAAENVCVH